MNYLVAFGILIGVVSVASDICKSPCTNGICVFHVEVELTAGQLGYFTVKECPNMTNPVLGMVVGQTYTFKQNATTNYFHPLGFAYYADGAHDDKDELEPGVAPYGTTSMCASTLTCPAPMYFRNGTYLGTYSNNPKITNLTKGKGDFGLDHYEPLFTLPFTQWIEQGEFEVKLRFNNANFTGDIFYFCHIHQYMTGRIKLLNNGLPIQEENLPVIPYAYDQPSDYDSTCGSFGLEQHQLPNTQCPNRFVCDPPSDPTIALYSSCNDAMNCHMFDGMTTRVSAESEVALFIHQMIPHHENAINMAKTLLLLGDLQCDDYLAETPDCIMYDILISIVNGQNHQIQQMRSILQELNYPASDDCKVQVSS